MPLDDAESSCHEHQSQHSTISINQLPLEVLAEVFKHCIPDPGDFAGIPKDLAPLLLCRVCLLWKKLAQSTPDLWTMMNIYVTEEARVGLEDVATFMTTWLERSHTLPLTIHLKITRSVSEALVNTIIKSLCEHALRWESVSIQQPYRSCVLPPTGVELPLLQSFKFDYDHVFPGEHSLPFASAPRLTYLHWPHPLSIGHPSVPWRRLRHIHFRFGLSQYAIVEILQGCPKLLELDVDVCQAASKNSLLPCKPRILHRRLSRLDITIWEACAPLLDSLTLPALRDLSLLIHISPDNPVVQTIHEQLLRLFSRSECTLDKLALLECKFNASMLQECFSHKSLVKLTELEIEADNPYHKPMITDGVLHDLTCTPSAGYGMLLPKLSSLTLRYCLSGSPGRLGRMILSRCPRPEKEGDRLKHFSLVEQQPLNVDDEERIDKACLQGLTAEIYTY
ncbi:hypothetical protein AX17_004343 [Amanita inopinata Kibby_2008]|nr:hypothetical protein AX17_004343 [Amanita inopinata Kibby_2008]